MAPVAVVREPQLPPQKGSLVRMSQSHEQQAERDRERHQKAHLPVAF